MSLCLHLPIFLIIALADIQKLVNVTKRCKDFFRYNLKHIFGFINLIIIKIKIPLDSIRSHKVSIRINKGIKSE